MTDDDLSELAELLDLNCQRVIARGGRISCDFVSPRRNWQSPLTATWGFNLLRDIAASSGLGNTGTAMFHYGFTQHLHPLTPGSARALRPSVAHAHPLYRLGLWFRERYCSKGAI